jgi:hypothetical protein
MDVRSIELFSNEMPLLHTLMQRSSDAKPFQIKSLHIGFKRRFVYERKNWNLNVRTILYVFIIKTV